MIRALLLFVLLIPFTCGADSANYICIIKQELRVTDDGNLKHYKKPIEINNTFAIDRKTGEILGRPFNNSTARKVEVITQGDSTRNFEVLSASSPTAKATTDFIVVHEWMKSHEKTFVGISSEGTTYTGTCK